DGTEEDAHAGRHEQALGVNVALADLGGLAIELGDAAAEVEPCKEPHPDRQAETDQQRRPEGDGTEPRRRLLPTEIDLEASAHGPGDTDACGVRRRAPLPGTAPGSPACGMG